MMKVQSLLLTFLLSLTVNRRPDGYLFAKVVIVTGVSLRNLAGQAGVRNSSKSPKVFTASQEVGDDGDIKSSGLPKTVTDVFDAEYSQSSGGNSLHQAMLKQTGEMCKGCSCIEPMTTKTITVFVFHFLKKAVLC
ncbi:hypothetical protein TGMAS_217520 [Toxoplasma gondii MAS]|uniref:Uncharacterized protein n=1 Tax=Toxoplasma gondii MAS TaxID=943118 RepID=A0A086QTD6_TOXGO|nr:hypothetical protein TGMAS_217520 [Toxoplasma gondii MAS]